MAVMHGGKRIPPRHRGHLRPGLCREVGTEIFILVQRQPLEGTDIRLRLKLVPQDTRDVFGGWNLALKIGQVEIEVFVIELLHTCNNTRFKSKRFTTIPVR